MANKPTCVFDRISTKAYMVREWVEAAHTRYQADIEVVQEHLNKPDKLFEGDEYIEEHILMGRTLGELEAWEEKLSSIWEYLCDLSDELESGDKDPSDVLGEVNKIIDAFGLELNDVGTVYASPKYDPK